MADEIYWGSDTGMVLGPYTKEGISQHIRAKNTLIANHGATDVYCIEGATSLEDAQAKLAAQRKRETTPKRTRTTRR
jgi:hypothetical protein